MDEALENQAIEVLEQKINQILTKLKKLQLDNQKLISKNQELERKLTEKERMILSTKKESLRYNSMTEEIEIYRKKEDQVRTKVQLLLDKLKEFDSI